MPLVMDLTWVGRRVAIRRVVERGVDGRQHFADIVGDLIDLGPDDALIDARSGLVPVPLAHVAAARIAEPSAADILALQGIAARGWRAAETAELGGWLLRADHGITGRANSVLPRRAPGRPLEPALDAAREWYAARGLPLRIQLAMPARWLLDLALADQGWPASPDVAVVAGRLGTLLASAPQGVDHNVVLAAVPDDAWLAHWRAGTADTTVFALLIRHERVAFASVARSGSRSGDVIGIARGAVDEGWLGITDLQVDKGHRRQGVATALLQALGQWAVESHRAHHSYLQVSADNAAALGLYAARGYWHHHDYRYRDDPYRDDPDGDATEATFGEDTRRERATVTSPATSPPPRMP